MLDRFVNTIHTQHLFTSSDQLIIAASGGMDSSVLVELCRQAGYPFILAHCNFQLRGAESSRDEAFVKTLGEKYGCPVKVKTFDTEKYADEQRISIQEAARTLRYNWFNELAKEMNAIVLTAHHKDDAIETVLMNFFRGTGLRGMTGIPYRNGRVRRPLLPFYREELETFAITRGLEWVEDSSNLSDKYTRNYFRNELLPAVEKVFPQVRKNLGEQVDRFAGIASLYEEATGALKKKLLKQVGREWKIPVKQLMQFNSPALVYEIIRDFGFGEKQVSDVMRIAESESGRYLVSPGGQWRLIRHRNWFVFSPSENIDSSNIIIEKGVSPVEFAGGRLEVEEFNEPVAITADPRIALLDRSKLEYPLLLRRRKTADYFYPLGMKKKKKLSRFFIDQKLSVTAKENAWVLENGDGRIIWVVGMRIDERFKISDGMAKGIRMKLV